MYLGAIQSSGRDLALKITATQNSQLIISAATAQDHVFTAGSEPLPRSHTGPVSILAVFSRYHEDVAWMTDPNTGIFNNETKQFILPLKIYQASDINGDGLPLFPGLPVPPPANFSLLSDEEKKNYSSVLPAVLPTWPEWSWEWVLSKNATKDKYRPGSLEEAEYLAKRRVGLPVDKVPSTNEEWRHYESLGVQHNRAPVEIEIDIENNTALEIDKESAIAAFTGKNKSESVLLPKISPVLPLTIVPNRGAESMAYLTAIIDHYHDLPDLMVFMHAHRDAWHTLLSQDWTLRRLATHPPLDPTLSSTNGYHALGCLERWRNDISQLFPADVDANWQSNNGPRWHESLASRFAQAWREHLGAAYEMPLPEYVRVPTAASFIASKVAILRRPKAFYEGLRQWMLDTHIENKWLGIVMEFQVGMMIANSTHVSQSQEQCLCELYSICTLHAEI